MNVFILKNISSTDIFSFKIKTYLTRLSKSISSEVLQNCNKDVWKMRVGKKEDKRS